MEEKKGDEEIEEESEMKNLSGEALADLNSIKTSIQCYYDLQKPRVMQALRLKARERLKEEGKIPDEDMEIDKKLANSYALLLKAEKELVKGLVLEARKKPVYDKFLKKIKGVGPVLSACFVGLIGDIKKFPNRAKLFAFAGLGAGYILAYCERKHKHIVYSMNNPYCNVLVDGEKCGKKLEIDQVVKDRAPHRKRGYIQHWNPLLKVTCWKAANSFIKFDCKYRKQYDRIKANYEIKYPNPIEIEEDGKKVKKYTKGHIHNMAIRKLATLFLSHLWEAWYDAEGLKMETKGYQFDVLKHKDFISYKEMFEDEEKDKEKK